MHLPANDATIVLEDEAGKEYETNFLVDRSGLSAGWRRFSLDHELKEDDVLVFVLVKPCKFKVAVKPSSYLDIQLLVSIPIIAFFNCLLILISQFRMD